jgi:hypothetical protein
VMFPLLSCSVASVVRALPGCHEIPDKFPVRIGLILLCRSKPLELSNLGPHFGNSLLIPVPNSKFAEYGHKSRILGRKTKKSLLISLF